MLNKLKNVLPEVIRLKKCNIQWRKKNPCNFTKMGKVFDISKVNVGVNTYGDINLFNFEKSNAKLAIGNYCSIGPDVSFLLDGEHDYKNISPFDIPSSIPNSLALKG